MSKTSTSTSMTKKLVTKPLGCTEFQLHKNVMQLPTDLDRSQLCDYTDHKLRRMIKLTHDADRKRALIELLADYQSGKVAVAWSDANPVYVNISKGV